MANILFTGGRAPAILELARAFHRASHMVFMAESLRGHLSEPSNALAENFLVPPPRQQTSAFLDTLESIVCENKIDLLIPTCEEVFYVAMGRDRLPAFVEPLEKLRPLHNKWDFIQTADALGLAIPATMLIESRVHLTSAFERWPRFVLKPVYSRFAARTLILPTYQQALSALTFDSRWVAQEFIEGTQVCTYSVCHNGRIVAHTAYRSEFTAGQGATILFQHIDHQPIFDWVTKFVVATSFTGQIAFDFIETADGDALALECNPRATSGIHLLAREPRFVDSFFNTSINCIQPSSSSSSMLLSGMLVYGLPASLRKREHGKWLAAFLSSRDTIFDPRDPSPFFLQARSILYYLRLARKQAISPLEASTYDIEWNGEP